MINKLHVTILINDAIKLLNKIHGQYFLGLTKCEKRPQEKYIKNDWAYCNISL